MNEAILASRAVVLRKRTRRLTGTVETVGPDGETITRVRRIRDEDHQRCGGGRRIIRKRIGHN